MGKGKEREKEKEKGKEKKPKVKGGAYHPPASLHRTLSQLGLRVVQIEADGNCFFRACADQLEGPGGDHTQLRRRVVEYMREHEDDFAPFVDEDQVFDTYCREMQQDGTWGGNLELQAVSMLHEVNICVHQPGQPRWEIVNAKKRGGFLHLAYEGGEHYNSVRKAADDGQGPVAPFDVAEEADAAAGRGGAPEAADDTEDAIQQLLYCTPCQDPTRAREVLRDMEGDFDAAMEVLIAEEAGPNEVVGALTCDSEVVDGETVDERGPCTRGLDSDHRVETPKGKTSKPKGKVDIAEKTKPKPNRACPCGSKKKYKACCGTAARATPTTNKNSKVDGKLSEALGALRI